MTSRLSCLHFLLLFALSGNCLAQYSNPEKEPTLPGWVKNIVPDYAASDSAANSAGYYYLLIDRQINIQKEQRYIHFAVKILNNDGVQEMSDLSIVYDPAYQKVVLHKLLILRNGQEINRLRQQALRLVQREDNMDRHMYDGRLTVIVNLADIRAGDIIEYAYSVTGDNPVYEGRFEERFYFQYSVPVEQQFTRLLVPAERNLHFRYKNGAAQPVTQTVNDGKTLTWEHRNSKPILYDINTPAWYDAFAGVSVSEYNSWGSISDEYANWYTLTAKDRKIFENRMGGLITDSNPDSFIIKAIRFVQDDIRYLAFEDGLNSHRPDLPANVLHQRYGDCKAKSFLLCEILRMQKVDAFPVLVNTSNGLTLEDELPSPNIFNHCIVQINRPGKSYYIDPTLSSQGGDLEHYYCPDYHKGLVLKQGENALTEIPFWGYSNTRVTETFKMSEIGKDASLVVSTIYRGGDADSQRAYFKGSNLEAVQKEYVNFYSRLYPTISVSGRIGIIDEREGINELLVEEHYHIDSLWERSTEKEQMLLASFYPLSLETYVSGKQSPARTMPYFISYPVDYEHKTVIILPEDWTVKNDSKKIQGESFVYAYDVNYAGKEISIIHKYKTFSNHIAAEKVGNYVSSHDEIMNNLTYTLTHDKSLMNSGFRLSLFAVTVALFTLITGVFCAVWLFRKYDIITDYRPTSSSQIGGWLILIGIGLSLSPFNLLVSFIRSPEFFNHNVWSALIPVYGSSKGLLMATLMSFELVYNVVIIVFTVLTAVLYFNRRTIFPKFAIILLIATFVIGLLDFLASGQLNPSVYSENEKLKFYKSIARSFIAAAIWVPYLLLSERVKQTFVCRSKYSSEINLR